MYQTPSLRIEACIGDRCGRIMPVDGKDFEYPERIAIDFVAGYGSVFGDGKRVRGDFCQHCVKKCLGRWLRRSDEPGHRSPHRALQPHQRQARAGRCGGGRGHE